MELHGCFGVYTVGMTGESALVATKRHLVNVAINRNYFRVSGRIGQLLRLLHRNRPVEQ